MISFARNAATPNAKVTMEVSESNAHLLQIVGDFEWRFGLALDLLHRYALCVLLQCQSFYPVDVEDGQVCDNCRHALLSGKRERAVVQDLRIALLVDVLHRDDDLGLCGVGDEVHCTADTLDFAGKHEVCEI